MQIVLLRNSGFSLAEIAILLREDAQAATRVLRQRIARLEAELGERRRALSRLKAVAERAVEASSLPIAQLLESIAMTTQLKVPFTPAEREAIAARALDPAQLEASQREWRLLIAEVRTAIDAGTAPDHPFAQDLARRWQAQVSAFSGGDATIARKVGQAYRADPNAMAAQGLDMAMFDYIAKALRATGEKLPEQA
jgi:DNA-binding transcriptional MerR regulator